METFLPKKICEKHLVSASEDSIKSICVIPVIPFVFLSFHSSRKTLISPHFSRLMNWKDTDKKLSRHLIKTLGLNFSIKNIKDMSFDSLVLRSWTPPRTASHSRPFVKHQRFAAWCLLSYIYGFLSHLYASSITCEPVKTSNKCIAWLYYASGLKKVKADFGLCKANQVEVIFPTYGAFLRQLQSSHVSLSKIPKEFSKKPYKTII